MLDLAQRPLLIPTGDPSPVEKAAVDGILDGFDPETFLWITFHRPDGGAHIWYAWTEGGHPLGNRIDQIALPAGLDAADWLHIGDRHCQESSRGRISIQAYALRPVLGDVQNGVRSPEDRRAGIIRISTAQPPGRARRRGLDAHGGSASARTCSPGRSPDPPWRRRSVAAAVLAERVAVPAMRSMTTGPIEQPLHMLPPAHDLSLRLVRQQDAVERVLVRFRDLMVHDR